MTIHSDWRWYSGRSDEIFQFGPYENKDDAIKEAQDDASGEFQDDNGDWKVGIHLCEATNPPLLLSDWIDADYIVDRAEESLCDSDRVGHDYDDGPFFLFLSSQENDLIAALKKACDDWQARSGLTFTSTTFQNVRSNEYLVVDHPNNTDAE